MKCPDSVSNARDTWSAYFTVLFAGSYVRRVSDLPSGSFPGACPEALAAELPSWDSCNHITHLNADAVSQPASSLFS